jgi:hypothetical protein
MFHFLTGFIVQLFFVNFLLAQNTSPASSATDNAVHSTVQYYKAAAGAQAGIYNGCDYQYTRISIGHPFFDSLYLVNGNIVYDNVEYTNLQMLYDLVRDEVVIENFDKLHLTVLAGNRVSRFSLLGCSFVNLTADSLPGSVIKTGFYQALYSGRVGVYAKNKKVIEEFIDVNKELKTIAIEKKKWYIYKDGTYTEVQGKSSVLKVFHDRKKEIQQYCKQNTIRYKNNMDTALTRIAAYYDTLTN